MFTEQQAGEIQEIVQELKKKGLYLGGSRQKLEDEDYTTERDWDFNCAKDFDPRHFDFRPSRNAKKVKIVMGLLGADRPIEIFEQPGYECVSFIALYEHKTYPHITIISRTDVNRYKRMFDRIPVDMWKMYLWKSNPDRGPIPKECISKILNVLWDMDEYFVDIKDYL